jgi:acetyl esterase/lipase
MVFTMMGVLFSACSGTGNVPDDQSKNPDKDLRYGLSSSQKLDLLFPDSPGSGSLNVILFIHGGSWSGGDKSAFSSHIREMCKRGLIAASMNYRLLQEGVHIADMLEDVDAAITFLKGKAVGRGITVNKIILFGASAGAHLSLLYAYKNHSVSPIPIGFVVGQSTPTDLTDPNYYPSSGPGSGDFTRISALTGISVTKDNYATPASMDAIKAISPAFQVNSSVPPTLFAQGLQDIVVPPSNADTLKTALTAAGVVHELYIYPHSGHDLGDSRDQHITEEFLYPKIISYIGAYCN